MWLVVPVLKKVGIKYLPYHRTIVLLDSIALDCNLHGGSAGSLLSTTVIPMPGPELTEEALSRGC